MIEHQSAYAIAKSVVYSSASKGVLREAAGLESIPHHMPSPREHSQAIVRILADGGGEQLAAQGVLAHLHVVALL